MLQADIAQQVRLARQNAVPDGPAPTGYRLTVVGQDPFQYAWRQASDEEIIVGNGDPNGDRNAPKGTLYVDVDAPSLWQNDDGLSSWTEVGAGGASSFPITFDNGTTTYTIEIDGTDLVMKVVTNAGPVEEAALRMAANGDTRLDVDGAFSLFNNGSDDITIASDRDLYLEADANTFLDGNGDTFINAAGAVWVIAGADQITLDGVNKFANATEIASGDLTASRFSIWLDPTPGATALNIKAKDSSGNVRTASIPLA